MEGKIRGRLGKGERELFMESIWRLANGYAGIMFSELFVARPCVCVYLLKGIQARQ